MSVPIKVIIIDSLFIVQEGLKTVLGHYEDIQIVEQITTAEQLTFALSKEQPDVVIFDHDINGPFKIFDLDRIVEAWPTVGLMMFSAHKHNRTVNQILAYRPSGYLFKECDEKEIISAVRATAAGEKFYCNKVLNILVKSDEEGVLADGCLPTRLSARELEVIAHISDGLTAHEMADRMFLSVHTVYTHRKNIFKKMGVHSTTEMLRLAADTALI